MGIKLPETTLANLSRVDHLWQRFKDNDRTVQQVVDCTESLAGEPDWDVVICGGTLGIFLGCTLAKRGWRVALLERGMLQGRQQEWNISRQELEVLLELELLTPAELTRAMVTQYNPARISFLGSPEVWVRDILNIGVEPIFLLETLKSKFLEYGGKLFEHTAFEKAVVHPDGVILQAGASLKARLMLDAMGHFSPIVAAARQGKTPEGICLVVGTCAQGFRENETGDLLVTRTPLQRQCQYFWEAFPAQDGRTTYLFTYLDTHPNRLSLETLFKDYLELLPDYQAVEPAQIQVQRALFGIFPSYRQSPLKTPWNRILAVGDSSGSQSPLSFGGFGAMLRHLQRLDAGIHEALQGDTLNAAALHLLQPYQPNLSVAWLFQRAMSVGIDQTVDPHQINQLLGQVFQVMQQLGEPVLHSFLQDVIQFSPLTQTLFRVGLKNPRLIANVTAQTGPVALLDWIYHYLMLGLYSCLDTLEPALRAKITALPPTQQYYSHRWLEAWKYGSGDDYPTLKHNFF